MIKRIAIETIKHFCIMVLVISIMFPLYYLLVLSLNTDQEYRSKIVSLTVRTYQFENFSKIFNSELWNIIAFMIILIFIINFIRISLYTTASFAMMNMKPVFRNIIIISFLLLSSIPEFVLYYPLKTFLNKHSIITHSLAFSLVSNGFFSFFLFYYTYKHLMTINIDKLRLAEIDKLRWYDKIFYVYWSRLRIAYFLIIIFTSIQIWNDYLWAKFILDSTYTQKVISTWYTTLGRDPFGGGFLLNQQAAGAMISLLFPLATYYIFSPFINKRMINA